MFKQFALLFISAFWIRTLYFPSEYCKYAFSIRDKTYDKTRQIGTYSEMEEEHDGSRIGAGGQGGTLAAAGRRRLIRFSGGWGRGGGEAPCEVGARGWQMQRVFMSRTYEESYYRLPRLTTPPLLPSSFPPRVEARWGWGKPRNYGGIAYVRCVPDVVLYKPRV